MRVLVTYASRHGGTAGIAEAVAAVLRHPDPVPEIEADWHIEVLPVEEVEDVAGYDAVVLGSAVYAGHWLDGARRFVQRWPAELRRRQVWFFSSGPVGDPAIPDTEAVEARIAAARIGAVGVRTFAGRLRAAELATTERAALEAAEGDYRDWAAIRAWADDILDALVTWEQERAEDLPEEPVRR